MKRLVIIFGLLVLAGLLAACSGGGGGDDGEELLPLAIQFVVASPNAGTEPLRSTLTAVITGGKAPFYYAWDFTSDGSPDFYENGQYSRTVNISHDYYRDPITPDEPFSVSLTVSDSDEGTKPVTWGLIPEDPDTDEALWGTIRETQQTSVTVLAEGGLVIDSNGTGWTTDTGDGLAHSGDPVHFSVAVMGGNAPYTFEWDFDEDGGADTSIQNPQHTFYYQDPEPGAIPPYEEFTVGVTIRDADGEMLGSAADSEVFTKNGVATIENGKLSMDIRVMEPGYTAPEDAGFEITISSDPTPAPGDPYPVISLKYNPNPSVAQEGQVPLQPELDLSIVVDPINGGGVQPYEYYWDFDNDGSIESQSLSPSVPFYDFGRKILINTYINSQDTKEFTLRCMVIDGTGHVENAYRTVVVQNTKNFAGDLVVVPSYSVAGTGKPFGVVVDKSLPSEDGYRDIRDELTDVIFNFDISGSTGVYDFQFDKEGDGEPEFPADGTFEPFSGSHITIDTSVSEFVTPYQGVGYFPAQITIRSLQNGAPAQSVTLDLPISLVGRKTMNVEGSLEKRFGHSVEASWITAQDEVDTDGNGVHLVSRELVIVGGAVGNTPLKNVEKIIELYPTPPFAAGDIEFADSITATDRIPIMHPRKGAMIWTEGMNYYVHGGEGINGEILPFVETIPVVDVGGLGGLLPWRELQDLRGYFPLKYGMGTRVTDLSTDIYPYGRGAIPGSTFDALVFCGGVYDDPEKVADVTNSSAYFYRAYFPEIQAPALSPTWQVVDADPIEAPNHDSYEGIPSQMITPRHEGNLVWDPDNRMLYALGGRTSSGRSTATVEVFSIDNMQWQNRPPMLYARAGGIAEYIDGRIYIMGGSNYPEDEGSQVVLTTAEVYDIDLGIWSETLPPSNPTHQPSAAPLPGPGSVSSDGVRLNTIWYYGGNTPMGETNVFEEFVYFHDVEMPVPPPPT